MRISSLENGRKHVQATPGCQPSGRQWVDRMLDCLLPPLCLHCGATDAISDGLCPVCRQSLQPLATQCERCALALPPRSADLCGQCLQYDHAIDHAWAGYAYTGVSRSLIRQLKFHQQLTAATTLGDALAQQQCPLNLASVDMLIPAPLHLQRLRQRGFNQALELCRSFARHHQLEICRDLLLREQPTQEQTRLSAKQRRRNVQHAFQCRNALKGEHVLLFDDVMTTGATMQAMALTLKQAGAAQVSAIAVARA